MNKKALLFTYDYELFLGARSGSARDCILGPTDDTAALLDRYGVKGVFFVDTAYLLRLRDTKHERAKADFEAVAKQLRRLAAAGHEICPHLHPHWLDAGYDAEKNEWNLADASRYRFHQCAPADRVALFEASVALLEEIVRPALPGYRPDCFRAGGWCLQPFDDFAPLFEKHGIRYDMTVLGGFYAFTDAQYFDFTRWPGKPVYRFDRDPCVENPAGPFTEFTISSVTPGARQRLVDRVWLKADAWLYRDQAYKRGSGYASGPLHPAPAPARAGHDILAGRYERIAVELLSPGRLQLYKRFLRANDYMHFISHPKMITPRHHQLFRRFLSYATSYYELETDFRKLEPPIPARA